MRAPEGDCSSWPGVDAESLAPSARQRFVARKQAVEMYLAQVPLVEIKGRTGVDRRELYDFLDRCLSVHEDGRINGFRALIPNIRLVESNRPQQLAESSKKIVGKRGALKALLIRYPGPQTLLDDAVLRPRRGARIAESRARLGSIHQRFIAQCRKLGLEASECYPFNTATLGYVAVARYIAHLYAGHPDNKALNEKGERYRNRLTTGDGTNRPELYAYERVECDAHKIDGMFCIYVRSPHGEHIPKLIPRLWLLVIVEAESRAILGHFLSLGKECDQDDLLQAFKAALSRWKPRELTVEGLAYQEGAGFPSSFCESLAGACWDEFSADGAKINWSARTLSVLKDVVGAVPATHGLRRRNPNDRPYVERVFGTLENAIHRLPNTTGTSPTDGRRNEAEKAAIRHAFQLEHLVEMVDVLIANYNGTPHSGIMNRTPLDYLRWRVRQETRAHPLRHLAPAEVTRIRAIRKVVRVNGTVGRAPHVYFEGAKYSSETLRRNTSLIGSHLSIEADPDELRVVYAFLPSGAEFGQLKALPPWHRTPHNLVVRRMVNQLRNRRLIHVTSASDPVRALLRYVESKDAKRAISSNAFLKVRQLLIDNAEDFERSAQASFNPARIADPLPSASCAPVSQGAGEDEDRLPVPVLRRPAVWKA